MLHLSNLFARLAIIGLRRRPRLVWGIRATVIQRDWRIQWPYRLCKPLSGGVGAFIANSQAGLDYYRQDGFKIHRAKVVFNGIDTRRFRFDDAGRQELREHWSVPQECVLVGMVARISVIKGHDLFVRMAHELLQSQTHMSFVCVGSGSTTLRADLDGLINELGISDAVRFLNDVSDVVPVFSAIDVVVLPSESEGFPNVIGEAMACSRPCVATDVGDVRTLLGPAGIVVPRGDHRALAEGVSKVLKSPDEYGDAARKRVKAKFSIDKMVADSLEFLQRGIVS